MENSTYLGSLLIPQRKREYFIILFIIYKFVQPVIIPIGLIGNGLTVYGMLRLSRGRHLISCKRYYTIIAAADFIVLLSKYFLASFLNDGLYLWTNWVFYIPFVSISQFGCRIHGVFWNMSEYVSDFLECYLSVERALAVLFPLQARSLLTTKFKTIVFTIMSIPGIIVTVPAAINYDVSSENNK